MNKSFEEKCIEAADNEEWDKLEDLALDELDETKGMSDRAFLYLGVSMYKIGHFTAAKAAFNKSIEQKAGCA